MPEYEVVTSFYTIVPWLSGGLIVLGLLTMIFTAIWLGWWSKTQTQKNKKVKLWIAFGWVPVFGIYLLSVLAASLIYYTSHDNLKQQIKLESNIEVITFIRGDDGAFIGQKNDDLLNCRLVAKERLNDTYSIDCK